MTQGDVAVDNGLPPSELEMMTAAVQRTCEKHMRDPLLITDNLDRCYRAGGIREFDRSSPQGVRKSLSHCHDVNQKLIASNDELRKQILELRKSAEWERDWRWGIVAAGITALLAAFLLHFAAL